VAALAPDRGRISVPQDSGLGLEPLGELITEADEFRGDGGKYNLNEYIKREATYSAVLINRRNTTPYEIRNITNWMFHAHDGVSHHCGSARP
jgi:hypothetical protein